MTFNLNKLGTKITELIGRFFWFVSLFIVLVILLIGYTYFLQPKWAEVKKTGILDYNTELKNKQEAEDYLARLDESLKKFQQINKSDVEKLAKILPAESGIPDLFIILEKLMAASQLKLKSLDISQGGGQAVGGQKLADTIPELQAEAVTSASVNINTLSINLNISGGKQYSDLKNLLENIEKEIRIMDIVSLTYSPPGGGVSGGEASYSINLTTYYLTDTP